MVRWLWRYWLIVGLALSWGAGGLPASASAQLAPPNDPRFTEQWGLIQVGALCAWGYTQNAVPVLVAVVDSGVDLGHPDLQGRLRDGGYDFVDDDTEPYDANGHGTNVAGVIAAVANNGEGIAGLAPSVQILPVRVMDAQGYGSEEQIAAGIRYAADHGARVINLSLGASLYLAAERESALVGEAIRYAQSLGALVVVAAGNDFVPAPNIVGASNLEVLAVAASDQQDRKAPFSNYGPTIDVVAPGVAILSTMPTYEVYLTSAALPENQRFLPNYDYMSGTSQAAPYVAALAGLLFAQHPDWQAKQVATQIRASAVDVYAANPELASGKQLGSGRIDACKALGGTTQPDPGLTLTTQQQGWLALSRRELLLAMLAAGLALALVVLALTLRPARRLPNIAVRAVTGPELPQIQLPPDHVSPAPQANIIWGQLLVAAGPGLNRQYPLRGSELVVGRGLDCDVALQGDAAISRRHLRLSHSGKRMFAVDLASTHGTYLNGQRLHGRALLHDGDLIQIGQTRLRLVVTSDEC